MKAVLTSILVIVIGFVAYGYYINGENLGEGEKYIGIGVLILAFILLPLFVFHRYKNKDLRNYSFKDFSKEVEDKFKD
jgi:Na+/proline symporter